MRSDRETQQFNTTMSLGRLTLNILLSFAQFEREIIGERTRDKMSAARRKGKWVGGTPVLGYDVDPGGWTADCEREGSAASARDLWALQDPPFAVESHDRTRRHAVDKQILEIPAAQTERTGICSSFEGRYRACGPAVYASHPAEPTHQRNLCR